MEVDTNELESLLQHIVELYGEMFVFPELENTKVTDTDTESYEIVRDNMESLHLAIVTVLEQ